VSDAWVGVVGSVIVAVLTLIGVLTSNSRAQAVTDTKLEELTREVREHNNFAKRVPVLEEKIKAANKRIDDLETGK
jgi:low affinity Fe/Cu permease